MTPLQMALVGATIADKGLVPKPYLVQKVVAADGSTVTKTQPQTLGRAIKPQTAAELNQMMQLVVQGGTAAGIFPSSLKVAGKTGTAELGLGDVYDAWFVAFAPADDPALRRRGRGREAAERLRRLGLGSDRQGHPRKAPARLNMSLPFRRPWR